MKLFAKNRPPRRIWKYRARGGIWRIYPTGTDLLFGEDRDIDKKRAGFFSLDRHSGDQFWVGERVHDWWVGVEGVIGETLLLHGFATPDMPMHRGILAVDGRTGQTVWENPEVCFEQTTVNGIIASRGASGGRLFLLLEANTGDQVREWREGSEVAPGPAEVIPGDGIHYPELLGDPGSSGFGQYLDDPSGPVSVLDEGGTCIISSRRGGETEQMMTIFDAGSGTDLYSDRITAGEGPFLPDSFLVQDGTLYYVKDRKELIAVKLPSETV